MTNKKILTFTLLFLITFSSLAIEKADATGLGVGPNYINFDSALKNTTYKQTIFIFNENNYDIEAELEIWGEPKDWIKFYEKNALCCEINSVYISNNSNKPIDCHISVPKDIINDLYEAVIYVNIFQVDNTKPDSNYSSVDLSLPIEVFVNVTGEQDYNVSVERISFQNVEIGNPAPITIQFKNNGNVQASPKLDVTITKDNIYIEKIASKSKNIEPGKSSIHTFEWNTTGKVSGKYNAYFEIYEGNNNIIQENVSVELFPIGSIERNGTFNGITVEGDLKKGEIARILATFSNLGLTKLEAQFFGEIYLDGNLIGTIESEKVKVAKYQTHQFISYLNLNTNGEYRIKGYILYGGTPTETKELKFNVGINLLGSPKVIILLVGFFTIGLAVLLYYIYKNRRRYGYDKISFKKKKPKTGLKLKRIISKKLSSLRATKAKESDLKIVNSNKPKKKRKIHVKKKKKPASFTIDDMSAKEIEDYVKSL